MEAPPYDLVLLLDAAAPTEQREKIVADLEQVITAQGTLLGIHPWGVRATAYEIRHQGDADYHLLQFTGPPELLEGLQHSLKITDGVVRFRIIRLKPGAPLAGEDQPTVGAVSDTE